MPTDTKLNNLVINYLTQEQYDAIESPNANELYLTPDNSTGGGGGGVSPCLNLLNMDTGEVRTSITEEEKNNLEKGLYNSVLYADVSAGEAAQMSIYFPETMATIVQGNPFFSTYDLSVDETTNSMTITGTSVYAIVVGEEKNEDGTYPIAIEKSFNGTFGGGSGGGSSFEEIEATADTSEQDFNYRLAKAPTGSMYVLSYKPEGSSLYTKILMINQGGYFEGFFETSLLGYNVCTYAFSNGTGVNIPNSFYLPPEIRNEDKGKFLKATAAHPSWEKINELPSYSQSDNGKALIVTDGNAQWTTTPRYEHTITIKNSAGAILWTQTMRNSKDTVVNSYANLKTLFGGATYAGFGEYCQLDLHGGTEATDKLIKADGTEVTLASLGAIVYADVCFLPK